MLCHALLYGHPCPCASIHACRVRPLSWLFDGVRASCSVFEGPERTAWCCVARRARLNAGKANAGEMGLMRCYGMRLLSEVDAKLKVDGIVEGLGDGMNKDGVFEEGPLSRR
jgi:hypothetical protein